MEERGTVDRAEPRGGEASGPRLAEATALLAVASDLATGMSLTATLRLCLATQSIAELIDDDSLDRRALHHLSLVRTFGCTYGTSAFSGAMGNELAIAEAFGSRDRASPREMFPLVLRTVGAGAPPLRRVRQLMAALAFASQSRALLAGHCEAAQLLTEHLGLGGAVAHALGFTYARWDGKGQPAGARGEAIPLLARVTQAGFEAVMQETVGGVDRVRVVARQRAGGELDPAIAAILHDHAADILEATHVPSPWSAVIDSAPGPERLLAPDQVDRTASALGCFADLKADCFAGHSLGVARLAEAAGTARGLAEPELRTLRHAALIHDLGRVGVTTMIWDRPGPLGDDDWEEVRLHPYNTERVAGRVGWLAAAARLAASHHERLDGSGYHHGSVATELSLPARLLAAADCYQALTEARPHRPAATPGDAARTLESEAGAGRLDTGAVRCVLEAAGHDVAARRRELPAGLTERELDILRVIAGGSTIKETARRLNVSPKTVDTHVQHIYGKVGCTTRAGVTVFAMQRGLMEPL